MDEKPKKSKQNAFPWPFGRTKPDLDRNGSNGQMASGEQARAQGTGGHAQGAGVGGISAAQQEQDNLEEVRTLVRSKLAVMELLIAENYVQSVVCSKLANRNTQSNLQPHTKRERQRGRKYVGESAAAPHMEGWLRRKGQGRLGLRRWNSRFFVLSKKTLVCRKPKGKDKHDVSIENSKSETIALAGCHVFLRDGYESKASRAARARAEKLRKKGDLNVSVPARIVKTNLICLEDSQGHTICLLQATSRAEATEWVTAIRKTIQMLPRTEPSVVDANLKRAVWLAFTATCIQDGVPFGPIESPKDALLRVSSTVVSKQVFGKFEDGGEIEVVITGDRDDATPQGNATNTQVPLPSTATGNANPNSTANSNSTTTTLHYRPSPPVAKIVEEECQRSWMNVCGTLQYIVPVLPSLVLEHASSLQLLFETYHEMLQQEMCGSTRLTLARIPECISILQRASMVAVDRLASHLVCDLKALLDIVQYPAIATVDPSKSMWQLGPKGFIPAAEMERFVTNYAVRLIQLPTLVSFLAQFEFKQSTNADDETQGTHDAEMEHLLNLFSQCCGFLGSIRVKGAKDTESSENRSRGLIPAMLSIVRAPEIVQSFAKLLQFRHLLTSHEQRQMNAAALVEEWLVTVDYTYDLLKDEVSDGRSNFVRIVERRGCDTKCGDMPWPVDAIAVFASLCDGVIDAVDVAFTELEQTFARGLGLKIRDQGRECHNDLADANISTELACAAFDASIISALRAFTGAVARSLTNTMLQVFQHTTAQFLVSSHVHMETEDFKCVIAKDQRAKARALVELKSAIASPSGIPAEIQGRLTHNEMVLVTLRRVVGDILWPAKREVEAAAEKALKVAWEAQEPTEQGALFQLVDSLELRYKPGGDKDLAAALEDTDDFNEGGTENASTAAASVSGSDYSSSGGE